MLGLCYKKMAMATSLLKDSGTRKWIMQVLVVLLLFGLLAWVAWLCYDYELRLNKKTNNQLTINSFSSF
jgi:uncharacterized membrane protein YdbT with pleckstrin-like domain